MYKLATRPRGRKAKTALMSNDFVIVERRDGPLLLSMPHAGTEIPDRLAPRLTDAGVAVADTDWWMERLYDFADELDATIIRMKLSRYVIDVNRDPSGRSLYPGQTTTELCPTLTFDGAAIYRPGRAPDEDDIAERRGRYFAPYHQALDSELARLKMAHGYALLYDCHSIRSVLPRLFEGTLPVFNIGTNGGASCAPGLQAEVVRAFAADESFDHVLNGRFKGGWITRHYGRPDHGVHAVQLEMAQRAYMAEVPPWALDSAKADRVRPTLRRALTAMIDWARKNLKGQK
jgi:N-formylglutamate deformylase